MDFFSKTKNKTSFFFIPLFIFFLNLIIKMLFITYRDVALDEPFTIYYSQQNISSIINMLYSENNPPLHFLLMHFWIKCFGIGVFSIRFLSVLFSSITAIIVYKIGLKYINQLIGIGASLIFTFSSMHIFFSHEARVYPLFSLLTSCSLYFYLNIIENHFKKSNYFLLLLINILLIYSHYFGFFVVFTQVVTLLFLEQKKSIWKPLFITMVLLSLSYVPVLLIFFHRLSISTSNGTWVVAPGITEIYGNINRFINNKYNTIVLIILIITACFILLKRNELKNRMKELFENKYSKIIFLWFAIPYLSMFIISFKYPMFIDRYILFTSIPLYLSIAIILNTFYSKPKIRIIAMSIFLVSQLFTINLNPDNNRRLKEVIKIFNILKKENSIAFIAPDYAYMSFCYHYNINYFAQAPKTMQLLNSENIYAVSKKNTTLKIIEKNNDKKSCIYIQAGSEFVDPTNSILNVISAKYKIHKTFHVFEIYDIHYFYN